MLTTVQPVTLTDARRPEIRFLPIDREETYLEWLSLFEHDPLANPVQHPAYVLEELKRIVIAKETQPAVIRCGTNTECDGIGVLVPKQVRTERVGGIGPGWSLRGLRLPGGSFLAVNSSVDTQSQLLSAAISHCAKVGADFLLIEDLDEKSPLHRAVYESDASGFQLFAAREVQPRWRIEFPRDEEAYWKTFSGRTRRAFRTRLRKFGETHLERITSVEQIPAFLTAAHEISKQSWQSRQFGLRIRNDQNELREMSILAQHGFLRSYLWQVEGKPAAFAFCHQHAGYFRYEEIAYCARFSALSPGETMLQQIVEDLYRHDLPQQFDFGGGDAEYKRRFGNLESHSQTLWLVPRTIRAGAALTYLHACRGVRSTGRRLVRLCGLATKARQWLRYGGRAANAKVETSQSSESDVESSTPDQKGQSQS